MSDYKNLKVEKSYHPDGKDWQIGGYIKFSKKGYWEIFCDTVLKDKIFYI